MRVVLASLVFVAMTSIAFGQEATEPAQKADQAKAAKILAEMYAKHGAIKNSPFSADEENESVQTLADGNRIVRKSTGKIYRNSEGRVRREMKGGQGGMFGSTFMFGDGVSIAHPAMGHKYLLDDALKTATIVGLTGDGVTINGNLKKLQELHKDGQKTTSSVIIQNKDGVVTSRSMTEEEQKAFKQLRTDEERKNFIENFLRRRSLNPDANTKIIEETVESTVNVTSDGKAVSTVVSPGIVSARIGGNIIGTGQNGLSYFGSESSKYDSKTEELGTRDFEGVSATGTRRTTTIPAGAIGNERPIEIVYERWYSKDLGMTVYSKNIDPRFGEQTYRLTNINRSEPDPSLFTVPQGYKTITSNGYKTNVVAPSVYRVVTTKPVEKSAAKPNQQ